MKNCYGIVIVIDKNSHQLKKLLTTIVLPYESVHIFYLNLLINLTYFPLNLFLSLLINVLFTFLLLVLGINVSMFHVSPNTAVFKICVTCNSKCTVNVHQKVCKVLLLGLSVNTVSGPPVNAVLVTTTRYNHMLPIQPLRMLLWVSLFVVLLILNFLFLQLLLNLILTYLYHNSVMYLCL